MTGGTKEEALSVDREWDGMRRSHGEHRRRWLTDQPTTVKWRRLLAVGASTTIEATRTTHL